jgi:hypothetical protein
MMKTPILQKVEKPGDLDKLNEITKGILGEICWRISFSYGDELILDIGQHILYESKNSWAEEGSWILGTRGTAWRIEAADKILTTSDEPPGVILQKTQNIANSSIIAFETAYPELSLTVIFGTGHNLLILPSTEDDEFNLSYWELFTPNKMILEVGPGALWTYKSAHEPYKPE